jgi:ribosome-binding factor A
MNRRNDSWFDAEFLEGLRQGGRGRRRGAGGDGGGGRKSRGRQKAMQLCRQAQRALSLARAGECDDDVLRSAYIADVVPAPDATQLLVQLVIPKSAGEDVRAEAVLARLERVRGVLRRAVAEAVTRKRAPELAFVIVPEGANEASGGGGGVA